MSLSPMLQGPEGLFTVSEAPRFLWHSASVGWQGAFFTELLSAPAGAVDHAHEHYCLRRAHDAYQGRTHRQTRWEWLPVGWALWRPGEEQRCEWKGRGRFQYLFLSLPRVEEVLESRLRATSSERWRQPDVGPVVERLLDAMSADLASGSLAGSLVGDSLITALCASLFLPTSNAVRSGGLMGSVRRRVLDRIEHDLARPLALAELAAEAGLGVRQFCRAFRASTGTSPYQYVLGQRVERAQRLIAAGRPLSQVALECGFANQSQLTRIFTQRVGISPAAYRRTLLW
jgi:AraC-like DNA-binding protein